MARRSAPRPPILPNVLVALGAALLVVAILLPTFIAPRLITTPLDTKATTVAAASASLLNTKSLAGARATVDQDVPVKITRTVSVVDPVSADELTFEAKQIVQRTDRVGQPPVNDIDPSIVDGNIDVVTVNRRTGASDGLKQGSIALEKDQDPDPVTHTGLSYKFPFDVQKQTYEFFDVNSRKAWPAQFQGDTDLNGSQVYKFVQKIPDTDLSTVAPTDKRNKLTLPASQVGLSGSEPVELHRFYRNTRTLYVDPASGAIVKGDEQLLQYYGRRSGDEVLTAFKINAGFDNATVEAQQKVAADADKQITLVRRVLPIAAAILGVLLLAGGILLLVRAHAARRPVAPRVV